MQTTNAPQADGPPGRTAPPARGIPWSRLALVGAVVLAVVAFYALGLQDYVSVKFLREHLDRLKTEVGRHFVLMLAIFFAVYVVLTALSLPAAVPLTLLGGVLFGRWVGTAVVSLASTLGATMAFLGSRYLLRDWVQRRFADRLQALNRGVEREGVFYLFTLRLVPLFPFSLINLGMGLTPMRVVPYMVVSWLGMLPGTFLYVNAAAELATLESPSGLLSWKVIGSLVLLGVIPLLIRKALDGLGPRTRAVSAGAAESARAEPGPAGPRRAGPARQE